MVAHPGELLIIDGGQTVDIINGPSEEGVFSCQLLTCDLCCSLSASGRKRRRRCRSMPSGAAQSTLRPEARFETTSGAGAPAAFSHHHRAAQNAGNCWLAQFGIRFIHNEAKDLTQRVRRCSQPIRTHLDRGQSRGNLSMSEVMLRRKLSMENTALRNLMIDARMSSALALLQSTDWPISASHNMSAMKARARLPNVFKRWLLRRPPFAGQRLWNRPQGPSNNRRRNINKRATKWLYLAGP